MKKRILSILLVMVMILTMTACATKTDTQATLFEDIGLYASDGRLSGVSLAVLLKLTSEEASAIMAELVSYSSTKELSIDDMNRIAMIFYNICDFVPDFDVADFKTQSTKAFRNVYAKALEQNIPIEELDQWTYVCNLDILLKYFSSDFSSVDSLDCNGIYGLNKDDAILLAETIFANPTFDGSHMIVYDALMCQYPEVNNIGLSVITRISKTSNPYDASSTFSLCRGYTTNSDINDVLTLEKLNEIRENIMENENFDFVTKYELFCNSSDEDVADAACNRLLSLAQDADEETAELIKQVAAKLHKDEAVSKLLHILENV